MPSLNVRLSVEQHAVLAAEAAREGRSLQRQIVFRLFGAGAAGGLVAGEENAVEGSGLSPARAADPAVSRAARSRCVREARHHINHSGRPCPECGYPARDGE